tara:strand:- start:165 stop:452 length:288 start_codon:yes stop_codon:yes gene_type:complete
MIGNNNVTMGSPLIELNGDKYRFDTNLMRWYCCDSPSWMRRYQMCYMQLNSRLTRMALDQGYDRSYFYPKPVPKAEKPARKQRAKKSNEMFIKID